MAMTDIEVLRAAKERLFERGWQQGALGREEGPNCLVGSIIHIFNGMNYHSPIYRSLAENIGLDVSIWTDKDLWKVEYFNDQASTTFDDVIDLIDRTIKTLEQEQEQVD